MATIHRSKTSGHYLWHCTFFWLGSAVFVLIYLDRLYKTWHFENSYLIIIVEKFRILFDLPRSSICIKDLLLHINPLCDIRDVHTKLWCPSKCIGLFCPERQSRQQNQIKVISFKFLNSFGL